MITAQGSGLAFDGGLKSLANRCENFYPAVILVIGLDFLFLLGKMKPELENQRALVRQHFFKAFDFRKPFVEFNRLDIAKQALNNRIGVPIAEKMPIFPLAGSACQKRPIGGRSRSGSEGAGKACVLMWRDREPPIRTLRFLLA